MKPRLISIAKKTGYVAAGLIITAAMLVAASRTLTPYLDARRGAIELWASDLFQRPIRIDNARVSWFQYQPGVALHNVSLLDAKTGEPVLQVRTVNVFFSIPKSLWQWKPVLSGILVSGTDLVIHQGKAGEFAVQGFPSLGGYDKEPFKAESKILDMLGWLTVQPFMILRDIDVRYTGITGQKRLITLNNLRIQNDESHHSVVGQAILHQDISTEVVVKASWDGVEPDLQKITGKLYINVSGMSLAQWFNDRSWNGWSIKKGLVSSKLWMFWRNGGFQRIQSTFEMLDIDMYSATKKTTQHVNRLSGDVGWKKEGENQIIAGDDILIDGTSRLWPVTSFYLKLAPDANAQLTPVIMNIGYIDLRDVRTMLEASPSFLPDNLMKAAASLKLAGSLENISASFSGDYAHLQPSIIQGGFTDIQVKPWQHIPGVKNLSGTFIWNGDNGSINLQSKELELRDDDIFGQPVMLDQLMGSVLWTHTPNKEWQLNFKSVQALNRDIALTLNGSLMASPSMQLNADLAANFTVRHVVNIMHYLPTKSFAPDLNQWLSHAFLAGDVESGSLILRGKLADFPFDKGNGDFVITGALNNINLHYAPEWPDLNNIVGKIKFSDHQILIDIDHAQILDVAVGKIQGSIPNIGSSGPSILTVTTTPIHTDFTEGMKVVHQSPLEKTIGKMFKNVSLSGPIDITLGLSVPLENPDNTKVKGEINIIKSSLKLVPWRLQIDKLNGKLDFTEDAINAPVINGELFAKPLLLTIASKSVGGHSRVVATIKNEIDLHDIETWLKMSFAAEASGTTALTTSLELALDQPINVHLQSDLTGITLNLPEQYAKSANEKRTLTADMTIVENAPLKLKFDYEKLLGAALILDRVHDKFVLQAADIKLGGGDAVWPKDKGLYVTGSLPLLNDDKIKNYLAMSGASHSSHLPIKMIDVTINQLIIYGIKLTDVKLQLVPENKSWTVTISCPEVAGKISIPLDFTAAATLVADLQHINLDALTQKNAGAMDISANSLPSIKFSADSLVFGGSRLGSVSFNTIPSKRGLLISNFSIRSNELNLQASGDWVQSGKSNTTQLHGKATSKSVSVLLSNLGFNARNFVSSSGKLEFDLSWSSAPYGLSLQNMSGDAALDMGQGRIVEIGESSNAKMDLGRMLNLFSLQSIPRRLSFDFSDVFSKGYSFDSLRGDYKFNNGNASTSNMRFDGPIARIEIHGRIGMTKKDFDLVLSVTPYVTSSIPIAATLITGQPVIGIAAWAVNKMIGGEVSKVITYYYSVAGSWSNPTWNAIQKR